MEQFNGILCISGHELIGSGDEGIMTEVIYKNLRSRRRMQVVRRGCYATPALVSVDSLPTKYRNAVYERYPDHRAQAAATPFIDSIVIDGQAISFFSSYKLPDGRHLTAERQAEYVNNASILNAFRDMLEKATSHRKRQGAARLPRARFWADACGALPRLQDRFPHSLPENARRLQERFRVYLTDGYESIISRKFLNKNASKVDDDVKESILVELIGDHRNLDNEQVMRLYNMMGERLGWKAITRQAVAVWRDKLELTTYAGRRGETAFRNQKTMQVKRSRPSYPLLYWTMDGWDVELLYQRTATDKQGRSLTTYHNRETVVVVLDPCVNYPVGYAIGSQESPDLIREALRDAANHTRELFGTRYRTCQLQCDHYAIKNLTPTYQVMSDKLTPARVKNAKAKVVEPYFRRLNKRYCQLMPNWSGFGVTSRKENQPNQDILNKNRHSFPDQQGVRAQIQHIIEMERSSKVERYKELYEKLPDENRLPLSDEQYLLNFGHDNGGKCAVNGSGLMPTIGGIRRQYDCFDVRFRQYTNIRWTIKYDPSDTTRVLAVNDDASLQFMLTEKYVQPMALAERKDGDHQALEAVRTFNKGLEQHVTERRALSGTTARELFEAHPELDGTLSKLVLVDSRGQHKDQRNAHRAVASHIDISSIDVKTVVDTTPESDHEDTDLFELY